MPDEILRHTRSTSELDKYVEDLIPPVLKHIDEVRQNQRYLIACYIRSMEQLSYEKRCKLCDHLMQNICITGTLNELYDYTDLERSVDMQKVFKYLKGNPNVNKR